MERLNDSTHQDEMNDPMSVLETKQFIFSGEDPACDYHITEKERNFWN